MDRLHTVPAPSGKQQHEKMKIKRNETGQHQIPGRSFCSFAPSSAPVPSWVSRSHRALSLGRGRWRHVRGQGSALAVVLKRHLWDLRFAWSLPWASLTLTIPLKSFPLSCSSCWVKSRMTSVSTFWMILLSWTKTDLAPMQRMILLFTSSNHRVWTGLAPLIRSKTTLYQDP